MTALHYKELNLPPDATKEAIKAAYRKLALQYHPDKHGGAKWAMEKMTRINRAYKYLMISSKPTETLPTRKPQPSPERKDPNPHLWMELKRPADIEIDLFLTLEEIFHGCTKTYRMSRNRPNVNDEKLFKIRVNRGCLDGTKFRFKRAGSYAFDETPPDVVFIARTKPHERFTRNASDIHYTCSIRYDAAFISRKIQIDMLNGTRISRDVKFGTRVLCLCDKGLPLPDNPKQRGNFVITLKYIKN